MASSKKEDKNPQNNITTSNDNLKPHQEPFHAQSKYELHHHQRQHYRDHRKQSSYLVKDTNEASFYLQKERARANFKPFLCMYPERDLQSP